MAGPASAFSSIGRGIIRHIHPGGEYVKGDADYAAMKVAIEELLKEK